MKGWIIYDREGIQRNAWFAQAFADGAARYGMEIELRIIERDESLEDADLPEFAIVRTIHPSLNEVLEAKGVRTFNNYRTSVTANDKYHTYEVCRRLGIPVMRTALLTQRDGSGITFPAVVKALDGHGGTEVFRVETADRLLELEGRIDPDNFLIQDFCSEPGRDMRVYVLGGEILAAVLRTSETDFRSNFSLGGKATLTEVEPKQQKVIQTLWKELQFDLVGIDFIRHQGEWVLNEIEDVVGTRMLYQCTKIDVVDCYMKYISDCLKVEKA